MAKASRPPCLICTKRIRPNRKVQVIEQGVTTRWGYRREMEIDDVALVHQSCFRRATRRYRGGVVRREREAG